MARCKVFIIGPHEEAKYRRLAEIVKAAFESARLEGILAFTDLEICDPTLNPGSDEFNDWILGQIDTANFVLADITDFNPNVIYEIAFAHAIGTPVQYVQIFKGKGLTKKQRRISHYFKFSLLTGVSSDQFWSNSPTELHDRVKMMFSNFAGLSQTLFSRYYGNVPPIDAEFTRGLARTYYRNFLGNILTLKEINTPSAARFVVVIPDTLEVGDRDVGKLFDEKILMTDDKLTIGSNSQGRPYTLKYSATRGIVYDVPTALFTLRDSSRYKKIAGASYFGEIELDRLTDVLSRKFTDELLNLREMDAPKLGPLDTQFQILWMSELIGSWLENKELENRVPLPAPRRAK